MRIGKSGNSLSANYIGGGGMERREFYSSHNKRNDHSSRWQDSTPGVYFITGIQRTFSNNFYFDANVGILALGDWRPGGYEILGMGDLQIGLKF